MKLKIIISLLTIFSLLSCNNNSKNIKQAENEVGENSIKNGNETDSLEQDYDVEEPVNPDLPASKYFEVTDISKAEYLNDSKFEMEVEILNKTDFKFKNFQLSARVSYKMKNEDVICERSAQHDEINPEVI